MKLKENQDFSGLGMWQFLACVFLATLPTRLLAQFHCQKAEAFKGYGLAGLSFHQHVTQDVWSCFLRCKQNPYHCQSINYNLETSLCEHNNRTRASRPSHFVPRKGTVYFDNPLRAILGSTPALFGLSCKEIKSSSPTATTGEYWIDPLLSGKPFTVFCDMDTDGGGWTLLAQTVVNNNTAKPQLIKETNYRQISNYTNNGLRVDTFAISQLQKGLKFRQLRYYCRRQSVGRTVHIMTTMNSLGYAVVRYFVSDPTQQPAACGSFEKLPNDNSILAAACSKWGDDGKKAECNKWGYFVNNSTYRIYNTPAFWQNNSYYSAIPSGLLCDEMEADNNTQSSGDSWKVFLR